LNRFSTKAVAKLQPAFKNVGRGTVKADKEAEEKGLWQPAVGTYRPLVDATKVNDQDKLTKIDPEPDRSAHRLKTSLQ